MKNTTKNPPKLRLLKLVSGSTILANIVVLRARESVELHKPMEVVNISDHTTGQSRVMFMDFVPGSKSENLYMNSCHIMCKAEVDERLTDMYNKATKPTNPNTIEQPPTKQVLVP